MDGLLPDEFPFSRRREVTVREDATAVEPAASATAAPAMKLTEPAKPQAATVATATAKQPSAPTALAVFPRAAEQSDNPSNLPMVAPYRGPERRRAPRLPMRVLSIFRGDINPAGAGPVQLINVSMCGVRLWSARPLKIGERGTVKLEVGPVRWSTRVRVIACDSRDGEGFTVGCEFAGCEGKRRVA